MYLRLPMGVKSAPELYQRCIEEIYQGMENFENIFDDILLHTLSLDGQCKVLRETLERARENDLTFRLSKCIFAQPKVEYTGHSLTESNQRKGPSNTRNEGTAIKRTSAYFTRHGNICQNTSQTSQR